MLCYHFKLLKNDIIIHFKTFNINQLKNDCTDYHLLNINFNSKLYIVIKTHKIVLNIKLY